MSLSSRIFYFSLGSIVTVIFIFFMIAFFNPERPATSGLDTPGAPSQSMPPFVQATNQAFPPFIPTPVGVVPPALITPGAAGS